MNEYVRYVELEGKTTLNNGKQKAQWLALAFACVALVFLMTTVVGLLGPSFLAKTMLMVNGLVLGPILIAMVWLGVGSADIVQHLFPDAIKGGEIHTAKWVQVTAQVVATDVAILMIPSFWKFDQPWVYVLVVALIIIYAYSKIAGSPAGAKK